jgi:hypothetical protein
MNCKIPIWLGYAMAGYIVASFYYLARTHFIGTPFKDSLTEKQKKIKKASAEVRRNIFLEGILCATVLLLALQPFKSCQ